MLLACTVQINVAQTSPAAGGRLRCSERNRSNVEANPPERTRRNASVSLRYADPIRTYADAQREVTCEGSCVSTWKKCGGRGITQHKPCCSPDDACFQRNSHFAQCRPKNRKLPASWTSGEVVKCGGAPRVAGLYGCFRRALHTASRLLLFCHTMRPCCATKAQHIVVSLSSSQITATGDSHLFAAKSPAPAAGAVTVKKSDGADGAPASEPVAADVCGDVFKSGVQFDPKTDCAVPNCKSAVPQTTCAPRSLSERVCVVT